MTFTPAEALALIEWYRTLLGPGDDACSGLTVRDVAARLIALIEADDPAALIHLGRQPELRRTLHDMASRVLADRQA